MSDVPAVELKGVVKDYGGVRAVDGVSLRVPPVFCGFGDSGPRTMLILQSEGTGTTKLRAIALPELPAAADTAIEETVVVSGQSPVVDVQNASRQTVLSKDILNAIPTAGSYNAVLVLVPGLFG